MTPQSTVASFNSVSNDTVVISLKNIYQQIFDFPCDVIKHILANANYNVVKKLYLTCKYFPYKYRLYLADNLERSTLIFKHSRKPMSSNTFSLFNDRIWLGHRIGSDEWDISTLALKVEKCTITTLRCDGNSLSWNDFKIIAEARTIEVLEIPYIMDTDGKKVPIENVCDYTPNLNSFESMGTHVTPNTIKSICNSLISTNMKYFHMYRVDGLLNIKDYLKFMKLHPKASFTVLYPSASQRREFHAAVKSEIQTWPEPKPNYLAD